MQNSRQTKMYEVLHYLYARVLQSGPEQEQLPGEIELCHKFGVSRGTVQRAIEALMLNGYLSRLPKRRGIFSNPALAGLIPCSIGIVAGTGITQIMGELESSALSGFSKKLVARAGHPLLFHHISVESPKQLEARLKSHGIRGLFWIAPEKDCIPVFDQLVAHDFPAVALLSPYYHSEHPSPKYNALTRDYRAHGLKLAEFVLERGFRRPLYCGLSGTTFHAFREKLAEHGVKPDPGLLIEAGHGFENQLTALLAAKQPDCIILCGGNPRYNAVVNALSARPSSRKIPVLLIQDSTTQRYRMNYLELNLIFHSQHSSNQDMFQLGGRAAAMLLKLLKHPERKLPLVRWDS